jgi:hypothetical protein
MKKNEGWVEVTIINQNGPKELNSKEKLLKAQLSKIVVVLHVHQMTCPQIENKLMGMRFLENWVVNYDLLKQSRPDLGLTKSKATLSVGAFYSHILVSLPNVI